MKSTLATKQTHNPVWYHIDANGVILGRLAAGVATILMGKHRPGYTPHVDTGDYVVITNAEKIKLSGNKEEAKSYDRYSGYPGGLKTTSLSTYRERKPEFIIEQAVRRMLPKTKLGDKMYKKMKLVIGPDHNFSAQKPETLDFKGQNSVYQK